MLNTKNTLIKLFWILLAVQGCSKVSNFAQLESNYGKLNFSDNIAEKNQYFVKQKVGLIFIDKANTLDKRYELAASRFEKIIKLRGQYSTFLLDKKIAALFADLFADYFAPETIDEKSFSPYFKDYEKLIFVKTQAFLETSQNTDKQKETFALKLFVYDKRGRLINNLSKQTFEFDKNDESFSSFRIKIMPFIDKFLPIKGLIIDIRDSNKLALVSVGRTAGVFKGQNFRLHHQNSPQAEAYANASVVEVFEDFSIMQTEHKKNNVKLGDFAFSGLSE